MHKKTVKVFCFPYAGGSSYSYKSFEPFLPADIVWAPVEMPGRGCRMPEVLLTSADLVIKDLFKQIVDKLQHPYAFYGHSMGSLLAYLLSRYIVARGYPAPVHLFLSGRGAPSCQRLEEQYHQLPYQQFIDKLRQLGGCPDELFNDPQLLAFFEPILRADFQVVESYQYQEAAPIHIPISILYGDQETITHEQVLLWQKETSASIEPIQFPGNHFFIFSRQQEIVDIIKKNLLKYL